MTELNQSELSLVIGGGMMYDIGYEIGRGLGGDWGRELGSWLYDTIH